MKIGIQVLFYIRTKFVVNNCCLEILNVFLISQRFVDDNFIFSTSKIFYKERE